LSLAAGQPGEVVVSGRHVLAGYLHGRGEEETMIRAGDTVWHRTGDAGYLDAKGRLWLVGCCTARVSDQHGEQYPLAVEAAAHEHQPLRRAALISHAGRRILAVEPAAGCHVDTSALRHVLSWAQLDHVRICQRIPVDRRHNSKVDYTALKHLLK
jgi:acyl-CoA synthetase (AMP-forming)/AMP-acid ligase II